MSKNERSTPPKHAAETKRQPQKRRTSNERVRRTCERLGSALITLIVEKPVREVTVQDVLDRAAVGRSTFYLHYRDKDDLLLSQLEQFLETMSTALSRRKEQSHRIVPIEELFAHIGNQNRLYRTLVESGHIKVFFELAQGHFARGIEQRLIESKRLKHLPQRLLRARSGALAGSMLALLQWWLAHGEKESPREMDELFHRTVWNGVA